MNDTLSYDEAFQEISAAKTKEGATLRLWTMDQKGMISTATVHRLSAWIADKFADTTEKQATLATWLTNNIDWQSVTPEKLAHSLLARFYVADKPPTNAALVAALERYLKASRSYESKRHTAGPKGVQDALDELVDAGMQAEAALAAARAKGEA